MLGGQAERKIGGQRERSEQIGGSHPVPLGGARPELGFAHWRRSLAIRTPGSIIQAVTQTQTRSAALDGEPAGALSADRVRASQAEFLTMPGYRVAQNAVA